MPAYGPAGGHVLSSLTKTLQHVVHRRIVGGKMGCAKRGVSPEISSRLKFRCCPSVPLMDWFKLRKQVFQTVKLIDKQRRHPIRQQLVGCPDMVGQSGCHRWSARPPTPRGSASTRWLVHRQLLPQTVMGQHEMRVCQ